MKGTNVMMKKIIEMCCDDTIMIFVINTKMNNKQIEQCIIDMYDECDILNVYDYDKKTFDEIIMHYKYDFDVLKIELYKIARSINNYSNEQTIENVMFCLMRDCVLTFFEI